MASPRNAGPFRFYVDTSVYGGVFDEGFSLASVRFFDLVRKGKVRLVLSELVINELRDAPPQVRQLSAELIPIAEVTDVSENAIELHEAYIAARVVGPRHLTDAMHVATATVQECDAIVSWNFRHIVNFRRIPMYNGVNLSNGYRQISIYSPNEVIFDEDGDD